jgi:hypothetical protein
LNDADQGIQYVNLHGVSHTSLIAPHGKPTGAALSNDDRTPDCFDGYGFYSNLMSCSGNSGAGSYYCDHKADALVNQASTTRRWVQIATRCCAMHSGAFCRPPA